MLNQLELTCSSSFHRFALHWKDLVPVKRKAAGKMNYSALMWHQYHQKTANTVVSKMKTHSFNRVTGCPKKTETISGDEEQLFLASRIICSPKSPCQLQKQSVHSKIDSPTTKKRQGRPDKEAR